MRDFFVQMLSNLYFCPKRTDMITFKPIIISNNKVLEVIGHIPFEDAFKEAENFEKSKLSVLTLMALFKCDYNYNAACDAF